LAYAASQITDGNNQEGSCKRPAQTRRVYVSQGAAEEAVRSVEEALKDMEQNLTKMGDEIRKLTDVFINVVEPQLQ